MGEMSKYQGVYTPINMSYMKPTVSLGAKNPQLAMIGHVLALIGGVIAVVFGILGLFSGSLLWSLIGIITGAFIVVVEIDYIDLPFLKDPLVRGIVWIVLALAAFGLGWFASLLTLVAGILYLVYHFT
jgi:hypothetical protein